MRTQVAIIGGGPSGLLLSLLLHQRGIDTVVLERRTRDHVLSRIRAGVLERGTVGLLAEAGIDARLQAEGDVHDGCLMSWDDEETRIDFAEHTGHRVVVYGQTEVTRDLYDARERAGLATVFEAEDVTIHDAKGDGPARVTWDGGEVTADWVAGCDGFHGVSRKTIPEDVRQEFERVYPFGWLGILSETRPVHEELIYANSQRGFALCSMRSETLSRYYVQCPLEDSIEDWSDDRFWSELTARIPAHHADALETGPSIEKSIAPLRSFVAEPMRWGRLFLVGDAAHIVPPTGAKGLNLAMGDVHYLSRALAAHYAGDDAGVEGYSAQALARVWKAERFSWWMTSLLHRFPEQTPFDRRMQDAEFAHLKSSRAMQEVVAWNYVGLDF
ncbi:4-hydroxybenzoate 3-monooxygenase [Pseudaestuariivita sp.]|uniref:4-hydroxybenzoate 3-monooxygenase n=1 Tax=Pseudaestuariivita sp. TaxID=2211669 RepID=UPI004058538E